MRGPGDRLSQPNWVMVHDWEAAMGTFGMIVKRENLDRLHGASDVYWIVMVQDAGGGVEHLLLTDSEMSRVRHRVASNPEDTVMVPTWRHRFVSWLARLLT